MDEKKKTSVRARKNAHRWRLFRRKDVGVVHRRSTKPPVGLCYAIVLVAEVYEILGVTELDLLGGWYQLPNRLTASSHLAMVRR